MGWARGQDSNGRDIGYAVEAKCDHPECSAEIDRGLAYRCGGADFDLDTCEGYFCTDHRSGHWSQNLCDACAKRLVCDRCEEVTDDRHPDSCYPPGSSPPGVVL